jgi:hypothetical protein
MMPFETVFGHLIRKTLYAVRSNDELLIYEAYGAMTMARALDAITKKEAECINTALIVNWINNPADRKKYAKEITEDSVMSNIRRPHGT